MESRNFSAVGALASSARGPSFDSHSGQEKVSVSEYPFLRVLCRDDTKFKVCGPSDLDVKWRPLVQGKSTPVQVKEPYGNLDMVTYRLLICNCTPTIGQI